VICHLVKANPDLPQGNRVKRSVTKA
jgi:hypothetical protein